MESGDLADFAPLLRGECSIEDLRAKGINTKVIKKSKQRTRRVPTTDGQREEIIDREIELHDRGGVDFDRVIEHTDGKATPRHEVQQQSHITIEEANAKLDAILRRRLG